MWESQNFLVRVAVSNAEPPEAISHNFVSNFPKPARIPSVQYRLDFRHHFYQNLSCLASDFVFAILRKRVGELVPVVFQVLVLGSLLHLALACPPNHSTFLPNLLIVLSNFLVHTRIPLSPHQRELRHHLRQTYVLQASDSIYPTLVLMGVADYHRGHGRINPG